MPEVRLPDQGRSGCDRRSSYPRRGDREWVGKDRVRPSVACGRAAREVCVQRGGRHADRQVVRIDDEAASDATCRYDQRCLCGRARWADAWVGRVGAATHAEQEPPDPSNARKRQKQSLHSVNDWATESIG